MPEISDHLAGFLLRLMMPKPGISSAAVAPVEGLVAELITSKGITYATPPAIQTLADQSGNGNNVSQLTIAKQPNAAMVGGNQSVLFSGTDFLSLATLNPHGWTTGITLAAWTYLTTLPGAVAQALVIGAADAWVGFAAGGKAEALLYNGTTNKSIVAAGVITLNTWHMIALTDDNTTLNSYVDGVLVGSVASGGMMHWDNNQLSMGSNAGINPLAGYMGDCYVYSRALTPSEIMTLYAVGAN